jgi:hypothetical protein
MSNRLAILKALVAGGARVMLIDETSVIRTSGDMGHN